MRQRSKMMTKLWTIFIIISTMGFSQGITDEDFDGVPDTVDQCPHTPFLNEVNAQGCTTTILTLPSETEYDSMTLVLGYGFSINEDLVGREVQNTGIIQLNYYSNQWSYSMMTRYYSHNTDDGMLDTILKIKKRIVLQKKLRLGLGIGIKLPTYQFTGNRTDYIFYSSLNYYPNRKLSLFGGYSHTFIQDKQLIMPLQDTNSGYIGTGYFFTPSFYANLSLGLSQSKFVDEEVAIIVGSILYYKINTKWFTTLSYSNQIDHDRHDTLNLKLGYKFW